MNFPTQFNNFIVSGLRTGLVKTISVGAGQDQRMPRGRGCGENLGTERGRNAQGCNCVPDNMPEPVGDDYPALEPPSQPYPLVLHPRAATNPRGGWAL